MHRACRGRFRNVPRFPHKKAGNGLGQSLYSDGRLLSVISIICIICSSQRLSLYSEVPSPLPLYPSSCPAPVLTPLGPWVLRRPLRICSIVYRCVCVCMWQFGKIRGLFLERANPSSKNNSIWGWHFKIACRYVRGYALCDHMVFATGTLVNTCFSIGIGSFQK